MQCNQAGIDLIKKFEGCKLEAYLDQGGIPTIGWGQTGPYVYMGLEITQEQADNWLNQMVSNNSAALSRMVKIPITENMFAAFSSLAYNIGISAFSTSSALCLCNQGLLDQVPNHIRLWCKIKDPKTGDMIIDQGLLNRRDAECVLWNTL